MTIECTVLLGGSFDPVHAGHIALADHFCRLFATKQLRLIPAGQPWQKAPLIASPAQRVDMLRLAFAASPLSIIIDEQEIRRKSPCYTVDTLRTIRKECGKQAPLVLVIGADQLINLPTWHEWQALFYLAHIAVAQRPGFSVRPDACPANVQKQFFPRLSSAQTIRETPCGLTYLANNLPIDISATEIRKTVWQTAASHPHIPFGVLDYIVANHLYKN
ncbi:MAG: nicotinate (nicotinamide) nucleotide adenylyltransferase [Oxalobacter formigenes]|nr:nicotinate (nicotinamide) nucleotide adenylyltransferase [Oxalobacter formigenes]